MEVRLRGGGSESHCLCAQMGTWGDRPGEGVDK